MSFNPGVPGYEGEKHPCDAIPFRGIAGAAVARTQAIGSRCPEGRGARFRARVTPFRGLSKNIDSAPRCKGDSPFYIWISEGIGLRVV